VRRRVMPELKLIPTSQKLELDYQREALITGR
jgi:hypothetical protein